MEKYLDEKKAVANMMARLYERGLTTVSGGNISLRISKELFCITPSQVDKSCLKEDDIAIVSLKGENLTPHLKLSIESEMHRRLLINRTDINAIVHAHPIYASTFSAIEGKCPIKIDLTAEAYYFMKDVINVPYALMGTENLANKIAENGKIHDIMLLQNHGAIAMAKNLLGAFDRIDLLERAAQMTLIYEKLKESGKDIHTLTKEQCFEIEKMK